MDQRVSIITLGVKDLKKSRQFYKSLGWTESIKSNENIAFFQMGGIAFALYSREALAEDACTSDDGEGF